VRGQSGFDSKRAQRAAALAPRRGKASTCRGHSPPPSGDAGLRDSAVAPGTQDGRAGFESGSEARGRRAARSSCEETWAGTPREWTLHPSGDCSSPPRRLIPAHVLAAAGHLAPPRGSTVSRTHTNSQRTPNGWPRHAGKGPSDSGRSPSGRPTRGRSKCRALVASRRALAFDPGGRFLFLRRREPLDRAARPAVRPGSSRASRRFPGSLRRAVSPSSRSVAAAFTTGEGDRTIRMWDLETGATRL